jgi:aldehyde:ferredoxin oxidoreductase
VTERLAVIDLTAERVEVKDIPENILRMYLGGEGLNAYLLYNYLAPGTDPLSPENPLIFGAGLLSGYDVSSSRFEVTAKSVEGEGGFGTSNCGGHWAAELKFAGFQHLIIKGKAARPVYLWIHDGEIEFRDAAFLWGRDTYETQELVQDDLGDDQVKVAMIGQAGENLVRFANIMHGLKRAAGRTGMGCIMGSKLLKAIAVRGRQGLKAHDPAKLLDTYRRHYRQITGTKIYPVISRYGTLTIFCVANQSGTMSVRNNQANYFEEAEGRLDDEIFEEQYKTKTLACYGCPLRCSHRYRIGSGPYAGTWGEGPEFYMMAGFGPAVGNADWDLILAANTLINRYGLDVGSSSGYIAWLMELWQRGIISEKDTGGLDLAWGNKESILTLLHQMARNEGFGGRIGQLASRSANLFGEEAKKYLYMQRGMMHESPQNFRAARATALGEATASRGSDHLKGRCALEFFGMPPEILEKVYGRPVASALNSWEGKPWMAVWTQHFTTVVDSLGYCKFATTYPGSTHNLNYQSFCETINAVKDWSITPEELMKVGERVWNLERLYIQRETGVLREGDIPPRIYFEPQPLEPLKGEKLDHDDYDRALDEYYELRGWTKEGAPTQETLARLNLDREPSHLL